MLNGLTHCSTREFVMSCNGEKTGTAMVSTERLVRRFYDELWNQFDKTLIPQLLTTDITFRGSLGRHSVGHDAFGDYMDLVKAAFPDFRNIIDELTVDAVGHSAFTHLTYRGTHRGELFGVQPTGQLIEYKGTARLENRDGQIADIWVLGDLHDLMRQLRLGTGST